MIFFSAHGVPVAYVEEAGDPYKAEMEECIDLIMEELEKRNITNPYTLAYQVRFVFQFDFILILISPVDNRVQFTDVDIRVQLWFYGETFSSSLYIEIFFVFLIPIVC